MNPKWYDAIHYMVYDDLSVPQIAKAIGVSNQTIYNWRANEEFQEALQKELDRKLDVIRNRFKQDIDKVYDRVYDIATKSEDESTSLRASTFLMEQALGKAGSSIDVKTTQNIKVDKVANEDILAAFDE